MKPIMPGMFFKDIPLEPKAKPAGWTVVHVESGDRSTEAGEFDFGIARAVVIRNDQRTSTPQWMNYDQLVKRIESGQWVPTTVPLRPVVELAIVPEKKRHTRKGIQLAAQNEAIRQEEDRRWTIIAPVVALGRDMFFDHCRGAIIKAQAERFKITQVCVWQYLCLYWRYGCSRTGLRPRHRLAGQKSLKERIARYEAERAQGLNASFKAYKPGRKPVYAENPGIPMTIEDINRCRRAANTYLFKEDPKHELIYNYSYTYRALLADYYDRTNNPDNPAPTFYQFLKAVLSDPDFAKKSQKIIGRTHYKQNYRQLHGDTKSEVEGPGHLVQLDDFLAKVIATDEYGLLLGIVRIFAARDVWSGAIIGIHVTLEGSSHAEAMECLYVAFSDKAQFIKKYGLKIKPKDMPFQGVCRCVLTDGGPLGASLADTLPAEICELSITAAHRPDMKPDIESSFNSYLRQHAKQLDGYTPRKRARGDADPKDMACIKFRVIRQLTWTWVNIFNRHMLDRYPSPLVYNVGSKPPPPRPVDLWNWGLEHASGNLRHMSDLELRRGLMPRGDATLTDRRGLRFRGLRYVLNDPDAKIQGPLGLTGSDTVVVRYDSSYCRQILVEYDNKLLPATLLPGDDQIFGRMAFAEAENRMKHDRITQFKVKEEHEQLRVVSDADTRQIVAKERDDVTEKLGSKALRKIINANVSPDLPRGQVAARERAEHQQDIAGVFDPPDTPPTDAQQPPVNVPRKATKLSAADLLD
ncbi:MAG: hypothetical protein H3C27_07215 [Opitutaceae bacterium]|nr:hypothetical protein [Opitutaceae bacterium]